jgi:hypothetical protein
MSLSTDRPQSQPRHPCRTIPVGFITETQCPGAALPPDKNMTARGNGSRVEGTARHGYHLVIVVLEAVVI